MSFSNYLETEILDHIVGKDAFPSTAKVWIGLSRANPGEDNSGLDEPAVGDAYTRISTVAATWNAAADGSVTNANEITFPEATGSWGTISSFIIADASAVGTGNTLCYGDLDSTEAIGSGDTPKFASGSLKIKLD